jgi:hypothetical protein
MLGSSFQNRAMVHRRLENAKCGAREGNKINHEGYEVQHEVTRRKRSIEFDFPGAFAPFVVEEFGTPSPPTAQKAAFRENNG